MCKLFIFRENFGLGCLILVFTDELDKAWRALSEAKESVPKFLAEHEKNGLSRDEVLTVFVEQTKQRFGLVRTYELPVSA